MMRKLAPEARIFAIDPDPQVRAIAEDKPRIVNMQITFVTAMGDDKIAEIPYGTVEKVTISVVLHQCPDTVKAGILSNAFAILRSGGKLFMADYCSQPNLLIKMLFNQVRSLDGYENTHANKGGRIAGFISISGFAIVDLRWVMQTPRGAISLWVATKG
jgi:citrate lyase alpha subunit